MAYGYPLLLKHVLRTALSRAPEAEIVYRDTVRFTYRTLAERVARLANGLVSHGLRAGDTVGVLDWDSHRYLESYYAVPGIGAVLHMVNIRLSPEQILYTINHAADDVLLVHVDFLPLLADIWDRIEHVRTVIVLTDDGEVPSTALPIAVEYEAMLAVASPAYDFPDLDENTRATTFYTTGTTGLPKGVFFSHRQLVLHTLSLATALGTAPVQGRLHRADVYLPITPMFHVHAWGMPFVATLLGIKQVYPGRYTPEALLGLIEREGATISHCVPTLLHMVLTSPDSAKVDLSGWKVMIGGATLSKGLARAALDRGIDVFTVYGMSETCPILTVSHLRPDDPTFGADDEQVDVRCRAGAPLPLVDLRIVDEAMEPVSSKEGSIGEIVVRAPWATQGYLGDAENSETLWRGGYLHTNDIGHMRPDGYLQITDRTKDVIKSGGEWISSLEIESVLSQHPVVSEVAVIALPDAKWGERPHAIVVRKDKSCNQAAESELKAHFNAFVERGAISKWAVPERIVFADSIAKTSVGKIDKKKLREDHTG